MSGTAVDLHKKLHCIFILLKMLVLHIFVLLTCVLYTISFDMGLINGFFEKKTLNLGIVFHCEKFKSEEKLAHLFYKQFKRPVKIYNINKNFVENFISCGHVGIFLDGDCEETEAFLTQFGGKRSFSNKNHWLIHGRNNSILNIFNNVSMFVNADVNVAVCETNSSWTIFDVYNPSLKHGGKVNVTKIGFYNKKSGYAIRNFQGGKYWSRRNMTGVTLQSQIVFPEKFDEPFEIYLHSDKMRHKNYFNRLGNSIVSYCKDFYNFNLIVTQNTDKWGYDNIVRGLEKEIIDIGNSPMLIRLDRIGRISFSTREIIKVETKFIFRNLAKRPPLKILGPFSAQVWGITFTAALLIIILLKMIFEISVDKNNVSNSWSDLFLLISEAISQQGSSATTNLLCGKIVLLSTFVLFMLLFQFYSATLISFLILEPPDTIKTLTDIYHSNFKLASSDTFYHRSIMSTDLRPIVLLINRTRLNKNDSYVSTEVGLRLVEKGNYAFHVDVALAYPILSSTFDKRLICELKEISLLSHNIYLAIQRDSPFKEMFDSCLHKIWETGVFYREIRYWYPRKPECVHSASKVTQIELEEVYTIYILLTVGILASLGILVCEIGFKLSNWVHN